jgi:uncharacterized protein (TIGR02145 family)
MIPFLLIYLSAFSSVQNVDPFPVVISKTGRVWMDRNLGAQRPAVHSKDSNAFGDLYQWGRSKDGHQLRSSKLQKGKSKSNRPSHANFIISPFLPHHWQSDTLSPKVWDVSNNPCPSGFGIPTKEEWLAEIESWEFHHAKGALKSTLKLPLAGSRGKKDGVIYDTGRMARYWSLDANGVEAFALDLDSSQAKISKHFKAGGFSIRCIRQ